MDVPRNPERPLRSVASLPPEPVFTGPAGAAAPPEQRTRRDGTDGHHRNRAEEADPGFFGPGSVSWRLHADPLTGLAGLVAVLLQDLHPVAAAAAAEEGVGTWHRLERDARVLGTTTYGSRMAALTCAARLRAEAGMVAGYDPGSDRVFRGDDPDLLAWRHCAAVTSRLLVARAAGVELSEADTDTYVGEQLTAALLLGLEPDEVPATAAELHGCLDAGRALLQGPPGGREHVLALAGDPGTGRRGPALPPWAPVAGLAVAVLPGWARELYGVPEPGGVAGLRGATLAVGLRTLRTALSEARDGQPLRHLRLVTDTPDD
ncbi:hypothetical protein NUM3379_10440 [Kineococcus sp. NUM-3379]